MGTHAPSFPNSPNPTLEKASRAEEDDDDGHEVRWNDTPPLF